MESKNRLWIRVVSGERGSIIVVALLMVTLLAIIVIGGSRTSTTEVKIANNKRVNVRNLYIADALVNQAAAVLDFVQENAEDGLTNEQSSLKPGNYEGRRTESQAGTLTLNSQLSGWQPFSWKAPSTENWPNSVVWDSGANPNQGTDEFAFIIIKNGVADGGSLDMSASRLTEFNLRGRSTSGNGQAEISIGYKTRIK